jgi:hypothetical protein
MEDSDDLVQVINSVGDRALAEYQGVPSVQDNLWTVKLRAAFIDAANDGEFSKWGITDGIQLQSLPYKAGFMKNGRLFVLNPEKIADHIREIARSAGL